MRATPSPRLLLALFCALLAIALPAQAVQIVQPTDGAAVRGVVDVSGTTTGFATGRVSISVDNGPFVLAQGLSNWTFSWDSTTVPDGVYSIRARARETLFSLPVFAVIQVSVQNSAAPSVAITNPLDGAAITDTLVVTGTSTLATNVELAVDGGAFQPANGVAQWNVLLEPGVLTPGPHTLTARASDGAQQVFDSVGIVVAPPLPGTQSFTYVSSVDGEPMTAVLHLPPGYDPSVPTPLLVYLHGAGGNGTVLSNNAALRAELDARGWIGLSPDGRQWQLANQGCAWQFSPAYVDSPNPDAGPGERDIYDAIDFLAAGHAIDADRVYLSGFSYGGRGAYILGLKNPGYFAAIAPLGPPIDMFEVYERRREPAICKEGMLGGEPGDSPLVDTMYKITSGRFLIENAYNLPVFHGHGLLDTVASNLASNAPFLHGFHITTDGSWDGCHGATDLCFGHTPTLQELRAAHPEGYDWAYVFTPVGHVVDPFWFGGGPTPAGAVGTPDPNDPTALLGMFDFLAARTRVASPTTVVYKTYTDTHEQAYWLGLTSTTPWLDLPAGVRARRDDVTNTLELELVRAAELRVDVPLAGLELTTDRALTITIDALAEPAFDPALLDPGGALAPTIVLRGAFGGLDWVDVTLGGSPVPAALATTSADEVRVGPLAVTGPTTMVLQGRAAFVAFGVGTAGSFGVPALTGSGATAANQPVAFDVESAMPSTIGVMVVGSQAAQVPVLGVTLLATPDVLTPFLIDTDGTGSVPSTWPPLPPGTALFLQAGVLDPAGPLGWAASNGLQATTRP